VPESVESVSAFPEIAFIVPTGGGVLDGVVCHPPCAIHLAAAIPNSTANNSAGAVL